MNSGFGSYPVRHDDPLVGVLAAAANRLRTKLLQLDTSGLGLSDYSRRYLEGTLVNGVSKLNLYGYLLLLGMGHASESELHSKGVVDYGGGNGLLSLLAREAEIGHVVYADIEAATTKDARTLATALALEADAYVVGELDAVKVHLGSSGSVIDMMCSYDVIEHVYDIDTFLAGVPALSDGPLRAIFGSGANGANPRIRRNLMKLQRGLEHDGPEAQWGHKPSDADEAYQDIRKRIIRERGEKLAEPDVEALVLRTRGMARSDIERVTDEYLHDGVMPPPPSHPTNTCDPNTGNWAEHLMDPTHIAGILESKGLGATVLPGFYNPYLGTKGLASRILNRSIHSSGRIGLRLAPYYIVVGTRH